MSHTMETSLRGRRASHFSAADEPPTEAQKLGARIRRRWNLQQTAHGRKGSEDTSMSGSVRWAAGPGGLSEGSGSATLDAMRLDLGEHFPTHEELRLLPAEVRAAVEAKALGVLKGSLLPRIVLRIRMRARAALVRDLAARDVALNKPTPTALMSLPLFAKWQNLREIADAFEPRLFVRGEAVLHDGEPHETGLHILGFGTVDAASDSQGDGPAAQPAGASAGNGGGGQGAMRAVLSMSTRSGAASLRGHPLGAQSTSGLPTGPTSSKAGTVVGDANLATHQPQRRAIRCRSTEAVVWVLPFSVYAAALAEQPPHAQAAVRDAAARTREANMRDAYRRFLGAGALKRFREFATFDTPFLDAAGERFVPRAINAGDVLFAADEAATSIFFLVAGTMRLESDADDDGSILRVGSRRRATNAALVAEKQFRTVTAPAMLGGMSWMQSLKRRETAVAETNCDLLCLTREAIKADLAAAPRASVPRLYHGDDDASSLRFFRFVHAIPLLSQAISEIVAADEAAEAKAAAEAPRGTDGPKKKKKKDNGAQEDVDDWPMRLLRDVAAGLELRIYEPNATLCSTAEQVDRLIIPISGKARAVSKEPAQPLVLNECIGFPLLVAHRWYQRVIVGTQMEALELTYDAFVDILARHDPRVQRRLTTLSHALLYPDRAKPTALRTVHEAVASLRGPQLHPVTSLETLATGAAPSNIALAGNADIEEAVSGKGPSVCRRPTEAHLRKLKPIPVRTGMTCSVFSPNSKSRIMARGEGPGAHELVSLAILRGPGGAGGGGGAHHPGTSATPPPRLKPLVLGKSKPLTFGYGDHLPKFGTERR